MRVAFIHNSVPEYRIEFMRQLSNKCDVKYLITDPKLAQKVYGVVNINTVNVDIVNMSGFTQLKDEIKKYCPDIIVVPPVDDFYQFFCGIYAICIARLIRSKLVFWSEGWESFNMPFVKKCKKKVHRCMKFIIARLCDQCIASGSRSAMYFKTLGVDTGRIAVAYDSSTSPICADINIRAKCNIPLDARIVLFLGRIVQRKGLDLLIKAVASLKEDNVYLVVAGDGEHKSTCEKLVTDLNFEEKVKFIGKIQPDSRAAYFRAADVFVLPSFTLGGTIEAWGLTVNESLEQGTPVIATNAVGAAYDLLDGKCGSMVKENNVFELAEAIRHYIDKPKSELVSKYCRERYEKFSVKNMANDFYKTFKYTLSN